MIFPSLLLWARFVTTATALIYIGRENQLNVRIPRIESDATIDGALSADESRRQSAGAGRSVISA